MRRTCVAPFVSTHMNEYVCCSPPTTVSTSTMIGRVWPCHVAKIAAGTGRVRVFLITSPEMRGSVSVAFDMQALLSSARLLAVARSVTETAMAILTCIGPPDIREKQAHHVRFSENVNRMDNVSLEYRCPPIEPPNRKAGLEAVFSIRPSWIRRLLSDHAAARSSLSVPRAT